MLEEKYQKLLNKALILREAGDIRHRDISVLCCMFNWINFDKYTDVKNKRISAKALIDKADVSKATKALIAANILLESPNGFRLNESLSIEY